MTSPVSRLTQPLSPESARRIRLHLLLLPVYGWILVVWTAYVIDISPAGHLNRSGHVKGHDFVHFYVLGQIADEGVAADLYDFDAQAARTDRLVPSTPIDSSHFTARRCRCCSARWRSCRTRPRWPSG